MDRRLQLMVMISLVALLAPKAWSQQQETAAGTSTTAPQSNSSQKTTEPTMNTSTQGQQEEHPPKEAPMPPLSSAISITPGSEGSTVSYVLPSFEWTGLLQRANPHTTGSLVQTTQSIYLGSLTLQRVRKHSELNMDYAGGLSLSSASFLNSSQVTPSSYGTFHRLGVTAIQNFRSLKLTLSDSFTYLPESPYGFSGFSGLNSFGAGLGGSALGNQASINQALLPDQSILTGTSRRYSNTVVSEAEYRVGGRSAITATGTYGLLNFVDPGFINSRSWTLLAGYNYMIGARDQVSISYIDSLILFGGYNRGILSRGFEFGYGRRLTARLTVNLQGGPIAQQVSQPQGGTITRSFWATNDSLQYRSRAADFALTFLNFTTAGSGVLFGAKTISETVSASRSILRRYHGSLDSTHSYDQSLPQLSSSQPLTKAEIWSAGASVSREFRNHTSIYVNYQFQRQVSNRALCIGSNCTTSFLNHVVGFGINWHGRPIRIH